MHAHVCKLGCTEAPCSLQVVTRAPCAVLCIRQVRWNTCSKPDAMYPTKFVQKLAAFRIVAICQHPDINHQTWNQITLVCRREYCLSMSRSLPSTCNLAPQAAQALEQRHMVPAGAYCRACSPPLTSVPGSRVYLSSSLTAPKSIHSPCTCSNRFCSSSAQSHGACQTVEVPCASAHLSSGLGAPKVHTQQLHKQLRAAAPRSRPSLTFSRCP